MLPKQHRLTHEKDFERAFKFGRSFFTREVGIKFIKNGLSDTRIGFVVSNKLLKKAVARNKLKRQLRATFHKFLKDIKPGFDVMVIARVGIISLKYGEMVEKISQNLKRAGLRIKK